MRISHRYRFVFFANPKTGSSSVRQFLDPWTDVRPVRRFTDVTDDNPFHPHMRPAEAREQFDRFGWDFGGYARFACVRNPWARLVSLYRHVERDHVSSRGESLLPFEEWIRRLPVEDPDDPLRWRVEGTRSLEHFVRNESGDLLVDRVLRTEDLDRDLAPYLRSLRVPVPEGARPASRNVTGAGRDYVRWYTDLLIELVAELFRYEIVHYGYEFGQPA